MPRPPFALIIGDESGSAGALQPVLAEDGYAILRAYNGWQAFERLKLSVPDVVFIDSELEDIPAASLCAKLRADMRVSGCTAIIVVSPDAPTREQRLDAYGSGAWECIGQPIDADELLLRLEVYAAAKLEADIARGESLLDAETGLYSMHGVLQRTRELASYAARYQRALACIVLAPELADDEDPETEAANTAAAIRHLAGAIRQTVRGSDVVGRLGRANFVLLAPDTDTDGVQILAERLAQAAATTETDADDDVDIAPDSVVPRSEPITIHAGCFAVPNLESAGIQPTDLFTRATTALHEAQGNGARVRVFEPLPQLSAN